MGKENRPDDPLNDDVIMDEIDSISSCESIKQELSFTLESDTDDDDDEEYINVKISKKKAERALAAHFMPPPPPTYNPSPHPHHYYPPCGSTTIIYNNYYPPPCFVLPNHEPLPTRKKRPRSPTSDSDNQPYRPKHKHRKPNAS